ncbi:MAG: arylsulfatase [Chitinophagaceae bacterium]|nr:arylsulfatase [Chitinophagaceae bacterium]
MKRRFFNISTLALILAFVSCKSKKPHSELPNIVVVYVDDLGYGDLSCYGAMHVKTPHVDRLAEEGMLFTHAYATAAICTPSRYSFLTGKYHWRNTTTWSVGKIKGVSIAPGNAGLTIDTAQPTIAKALKQAGYATGVVGKWHLGLGPAGGTNWNGEITFSPLDIGFDYSFLMPATADRVPCVFVENHRVVGLDPTDPIEVSYDKPIGDISSIYNPDVTPGEIVSYDTNTKKQYPNVKMRPSFGHDQTIINGIPRIGYMTGGKAALWKDDEIAETFAQKALDFLDRNKDNPFFLYFATHDLHVPRVPGKAFAGKSGIGVYGDVIMQMDWTVGQLLNKLDELGLREKTIVILTSDNGPVMDDGYRDGSYDNLNGHNPSGNLREGKYSAYEGGARVPFIIRWPAKIKPGKSDALFSQVDLLATLASIAGNKDADKQTTDSRDYHPALLGKSNKGREYVVQQNMSSTLSIVKGDWKYIEPTDKPQFNLYTYPKTDMGNNKQPQLFNIAEDPREKENLAEKYPDKLKELKTLLTEIKNKK